jgi:Integrase zinc binding domain
MRQSHRRSLGTLSCSNCAKRSPISSYNNYWLPTQHCVAIKQPMLTHAVQWYHHALSHVGQNRLTDTMSMAFYSPLLRKTVKAVVLPCAHCQHCKNVQRGHGTTAPRETDILPWNHVAVDTIGPWVLTVQNRQEHFYALTIIHMVTNLSEIVCLQNICTCSNTVYQHMASQIPKTNILYL